MYSCFFITTTTTTTSTLFSPFCAVTDLSQINGVVDRKLEPKQNYGYCSSYKNRKTKTAKYKNNNTITRS